MVMCPRLVPGNTRIIFFVGLLLLGGCDAPMPDLDLTPKVNELFTTLGQGNIDQAMEFYPDEFFKAFPKEYWRERLEKFNQHMGTMESFRIRTKQSDTRFSGKFFVFQLETIHQDNKKARHIVTFVLPVDGSDVKLVGHKITAKGFH
jgi:hypothetical protein